jgi:hypothetical protein
MNPTIQDRRQPLPSLLTVYRPVEEYWESSGPAGGIGSDPSEVLDPLDALLVHRVLELVPGLPVLVDVAATKTAGASTLIGLTHPHVRGVWAVTRPGSLESERAVSALRAHVRSRAAGLAPLEVIARPEMLRALADQSRAVILVDVRAEDGAGLAEEIGRWLDEVPDAVVLLLGLGRVGSCRAIGSLLAGCAPDSRRRFQLVRELGEVLAASHLGVVARHDHPSIDAVLERLGQFYTGNYGFLDLLRQVNQGALREAQIDADILRNHPSSWALTVEIDELKRKAREANEQAAAAADALQAATAELEETRRALADVGILHFQRIRRRLAPTPLGAGWRLLKRVRRRLAPTFLGRAWRQSKRVVRDGLAGSR